MKLNAIVLGATGAIGRALSAQLSTDNNYQSLKLLVRSAEKAQLPKAENVLFDYAQADYPTNLFSEADVVFCCIGTTMAKAGSKDAFRAVDYEIPLRAAKACGPKTRFVLVSSVGANADTSNFYLRTKGELERELKAILHERLSAVRPSLLLAKRTERRLGEDFASAMYSITGWMFRGPLLRYKAIRVEDVARAMRAIAISEVPKLVYQSEELYQLAKGVN